MRIGSRLRMAFAVLLLLFMLLAGLTIYRLEHFSLAFTQLVSEQTEVLNDVNDVSTNADDAARKMLVLISLDREQRVLAYEEIGAANRRLDAAMQLLDKRLASTARRRALLDVKRSLDVYRERFKSTVNLIEADRTREAHEMLGTQTEEALSLLVDAIRALQASETVVSIESANRFRAEIGHDRQIVLVLCAVEALAGIGLALAVTRSIVRPLSLTERGARLISQGEYSQRIPELGDDEVGHLSQAMNTLATAVADRENQLMRLGNTDALTGLPLRTRFTVDGDRLLTDLIDQEAVLLCVDVDRLKTVNSVLGFDAGDSLLVGVAERLAALYEDRACFGRLAGGTFVALVPLGSGTADGTAAQLHSVMNRKFEWHGQRLDLSVTIGCAIFPGHARGTEPLLRFAEQAMFEAKRLRVEVSVYNPGLEASRRLHLSLLSDLESAIAGGHLRQFLQPKISLRDGKLQGCEALVRWKHPERGWLPPSEFVPFAESTGRIRQVTQWMLEQAIRTLVQWRARGIDSSIAVNLSTLDLQDQSLPNRIAALLDEASLPASALQLELTETGLMESTQDPIRVMHSLHELGVRLAIDDFGTGQSSLAYLQRLPVHELKIDRSFVDGVDHDTRRQDLLGSIVTLGHGLGLSVTAEGVENHAELAVLRRVGCDLVQGFLVAKPMETALYEAWRDQYQSSAAIGSVLRSAPHAP